MDVHYLCFELGDPALHLVDVRPADAAGKRAISVASGGQLGHQRVEIPLDGQQDVVGAWAAAAGPRQAQGRLCFIYGAVGFRSRVVLGYPFRPE